MDKHIIKAITIAEKNWKRAYETKQDPKKIFLLWQSYVALLGELYKDAKRQSNG